MGKNSTDHMKEQFKALERKKQTEIDLAYGKIPPQAIEIEEAVLGAVMLEKDAIFRVLPIIQSDAFYKESHRLIFKVVEELASANESIDLLTVTRKLMDVSLLEKVGGPGEITRFTRHVASAAHIEKHSRIIADKYYQREMIRRFQQLIATAYSDDIDELEMMYSMHTQAIDSLLAGNTGMTHIRDVLVKATKKLEQRVVLAQKGLTPGVPTGLADLNRKNKGWQAADLVIVAARPSMGKTAIAINLFAKAAAVRGVPVCIFSLEMENIKLSNRLVLSYGGVQRDNFEQGTMTDDDWRAYNQAVKELECLPIYIDDTPGPHVRYIDATVRNKVRKGECGLVIIDYLQLVETPDTYGNKNREREVAEISRALKKMAKANGVPVILLAQLNRGVENRPDKTPRLADLRESGAIEQDADVVIFPWRPCYYDINAEDDMGNSLKNIMFLEIAKYRDGGTGTILAKHNEDLTQFFDYSYHGYPESPEANAWMEG